MRKLHEKAIAFDPETIAVLVGALDDAWADVEASAVPVAAFQQGEVGARALLARRIIALAKRGERDPTQLTEDSLLHLARATGKTFNRC